MEQYAQHIAYKNVIYQAAMAEAGYSQTLIASGCQDHQFRDDIPVPFTTSAYFREWLPLQSHPESFLLLGRDAARPRLFLKVADDYWHSAPEALPVAISSVVDVVEYVSVSELKGHFSLPGKTAFIGAALPFDLSDTTLNPENLLRHVDYHRAWKSDYEIGSMRSANQLAVGGHRAAEDAFKEGLSECEIHLAYLSAVGCLEEQLPYPNIVALNEHAAVLHHNQLATRRPQESRSFLIDAGAQVNGYAADITRTYIRDGGDEIFAALIAGADQLQQRLVADLKPGTHYGELHHRAHLYIAGLLSELDIIKLSPEEAVHTGLTSAFFPHGLGHLIGVQVHDRGGQMSSVTGAIKAPPEQHPFLRCTRKVEVGMAFTIEPGIYFIPMLLQSWREKNSDAVNWPLVERLLPYGGVRIEDDVLVHPDRVENFTRAAFTLS